MITRETKINGRTTVWVTIGFETVTEPRTVRRSGQTACNWTEYEIQPGEYAIEVDLHGIDKFAYTRYDAVITDEYYVNRLFTATSIAPKTHVGQTTTYVAQGYPNTELAAQFATDRNFRLAEGVSITLYPYGERGRTLASFDIEERD